MHIPTESIPGSCQLWCFCLSNNSEFEKRFNTSLWQFFTAELMSGWKNGSEQRALTTFLLQPLKAKFRSCLQHNLKYNFCTVWKQDRPFGFFVVNTGKYLFVPMFYSGSLKDPATNCNHEHPEHLGLTQKLHLDFLCGQSTPYSSKSHFPSYGKMLV